MAFLNASDLHCQDAEDDASPRHHKQAESVGPSLAVIAAEELREALEQHEIAADVHDGYGLALVSVWVGLVVWCKDDRYWWRTGWDARRQRFTYAWHPTLEPVRAARRIAFRYAELRKVHPPSELMAGACGDPA
ncbi:hypothetical protein AB0M44_04590 [Streptosporangium subroseum]|uniref:hypothetical protein n=1 Tax=Streptosporangium subroseum TaxID=106412 RepID=UPI0034165415